MHLKGNFEITNASFNFYISAFKANIAHQLSCTYPYWDIELLILIEDIK